MSWKWTLGNKISAVVLVVGGLFVTQEVTYILPTFRSKLFQQRQEENRALVEVAFGVLEHFTKEEADGRATREQAQARA